MHVTNGTRDGGPVILLHVPSGGPPVTLDPAGWALLREAGVTSVVAQKGPSGEHIVARIGKRQTAAARMVWGDEPPTRIVFANGDRRDLRRTNLAAWAPSEGTVSRRSRVKASPLDAQPADPEVTSRATLSAAEREAAIRSMVRAGYRQAWHAGRDYLIRHRTYPLAALLFPPRRPHGRP